MNPIHNKTSIKHQYLCNLVLPGVGKSGTTSLHEILNQHPQISMSRHKEPQFFSFNELYQKGAEAHNELFKYNKDIKYYGESSQCYFFHEDTIKRIKENLREPRIIILLRDPIERLISHYRWKFIRGLETESFLRAIFEKGLNTEYIFDDYIKMFVGRGGYISMSQYAKYVPMWQQAFDSHNVLLLKTEDMKQNQNAVATRCFNFLGLCPVDNISSEIKVNQTTDVIRIRLPEPLHTLMRFLPSKIRKHSIYKKFNRRLLKITTQKPADILPSQLEVLKELLAKDIEFYNQI